MQRLVNTADESELPSQAVTVFAWSSKKHMVLQYPDGPIKRGTKEHFSVMKTVRSHWGKKSQGRLFQRDDPAE